MIKSCGAASEDGIMEEPIRSDSGADLLYQVADLLYQRSC